MAVNSSTIIANDVLHQFDNKISVPNVSNETILGFANFLNGHLGNVMDISILARLMQSRLTPGQRADIVKRIIVEEETRSKRKPIIAIAAVTETTARARARIMGLVGGGHRVEKTYHVGAVEATEVVPLHKIDPLYCVRRVDSPENKSLNNWFELAFFLAMSGKWNGDPTMRRQALNLGETAIT